MAGNAWACSRPPGLNDDTGTSNPEKRMVGTIAMISVMISAAICVRTSNEMTSPIPVPHRINSREAATNTVALPLNGT